MHHSIVDLVNKFTDVFRREWREKMKKDVTLVVLPLFMLKLGSKLCVVKSEADALFVKAALHQMATRGKLLIV